MARNPARSSEVGALIVCSAVRLTKRGSTRMAIGSECAPAEAAIGDDEQTAMDGAEYCLSRQPCGSSRPTTQPHELRIPQPTIAGRGSRYSIGLISRKHHVRFVVPQPAIERAKPRALRHRGSAGPTGRCSNRRINRWAHTRDCGPSDVMASGGNWREEVDGNVRPAMPSARSALYAPNEHSTPRLFGRGAFLLCVGAALVGSIKRAQPDAPPTPDMERCYHDGSTRIATGKCAPKW